MERDDIPEPKKPLLKDEMVLKIINEPKVLPKGSDIKWKKPQGQAHMRADLPLQCRYPCRISMRKSIDNPRNFSILLIHTQPTGQDTIIARYNGDHGLHKNKLTGEKIKGPHIHIISEEYQRYGEKPEGHATATDKYQSIEQAIVTFKSDMNIRDEGGGRIASLKRWE